MNGYVNTRYQHTNTSMRTVEFKVFIILELNDSSETE